MNQNWLVALRQKNFQNFGDDRGRGFHGWILVRLHENPVMSDTSIFEEGLMSQGVRLVNKSPVDKISISSQE